MPLRRVLEPEVMDSDEEARDYDAMDHAGVNAAFCDDLTALAPDLGAVLDVGTGTARIPATITAAQARSQRTSPSRTGSTAKGAMRAAKVGL